MMKKSTKRTDQQDVPRKPINMKEFNETLIKQESPTKHRISLGIEKPYQIT